MPPPNKGDAYIHSCTLDWNVKFDLEEQFLYSMLSKWYFLRDVSKAREMNFHGLVRKDDFGW